MRNHEVVIRKRKALTEVCKKCQNFLSCSRHGYCYVYFSLIAKSGLKCSSEDGRMLEWSTLEEAQTGIAKLIANGEIKLQDGDTIKMTCNKQIRVIDTKSLKEVEE